MQTPSLSKGGSVSLLYSEEADSFSMDSFPMRNKERLRKCGALLIRGEPGSVLCEEGVFFFYEEETDSGVTGDI